MWPAARSGRFTVLGRAHIRGIISAVSAAKPPLALRDTDNCSTVKFVPGHVINVMATIIDIAYLPRLVEFGFDRNVP
jgi:hypothetical protein